MLYINLIHNRVSEIIPEADSRFPGVPIEQRYSADFLAACIKVANNAAVSVGMEYRDGVFAAPTPVPTPETPLEPTTAESIMLAIADVDAQREADRIANQLAIAELAEALLTGGAK